MTDKRTVYERPRVDKLLSGISSRPLTVVAATAGFGKTTAVRSFLSRSRLRCAWVSLTSGDELVFWDKLCRAVAELSPEKGAELASISLPKSDIQAARVADLANGVTGGLFVLVIDDYHLIPDESRLNDLIRVLMLEEPQNFRLVLVSRSLPAVEPVTLSVKGLCTIITSADLAFTPEETDGYLSSRGLQLTGRAVARIYEHTEGWISAIFLVSEGVRNGLAVSDESGIDSLIEENLLSALDEDSRSILVRLSSLDSFTAAQAVHAVRCEKAAALLAGLARHNAFTTADAGRYSFHSLLRSHLAKKRTPAEYRETLLRSADWLKENGCLREALCALLAAGAFETILKELDRPGHPQRRFVSSSNVGVFFAALDNEKMCLEYPFSYLHLIFFSFISGVTEYRAKAARLLSLMKEHFASVSGGRARRILGECCVAESFGDALENVPAHLAAAREYLNGEASELVRSGDPCTFGVPSLLFAFYKRPGELDRTVSCLCNDTLEEIKGSLGRGKDKLAAAEAALLRLDLHNARMLAEQALLMAADAKQTAIAAAASFTLMRADLCEGGYAAAALRLDDIRGYPERFGVSFDFFNHDSYADLTDAAAGYMAACLGRPEKIPQLLTVAKKHGGLMHNGFGFFSLIRAKAALLSGRPSDAEAICVNCERELSVTPSQLGRLQMLIDQAAVKSALGEKRAASEILSAAVREAELDGVALPFAENAGLIEAPLADVCAAGSDNSRFLLKIAKACRSYKANLAAGRLPGGTVLSAREKETLRLAAAGRTQAEVAAVMKVTQATVKKHLISAYRKLGAQNRLSAVKAAESLGLL